MLSKRVRNLISRGSAFLLSAAIAWACVRMAMNGVHPVLWLPLAAIGLIPLAFSLIPTPWLYRLNPSHSNAESADVVHILELFH